MLQRRLCRCSDTFSRLTMEHEERIETHGFDYRCCRETKMDVSRSHDELDLKALLSALWRGWKLITLSTVVGSVLALAYALLATKVYRAEALVQVRTETGGGGAALGAL